MNVENLNQLEDRIEKPAYLLFLVVVLLFLIIGFVNLIDHNSANTAVFNRYSLPYFGLIIAYALGTIGWAALLLRPNDDRLLRRSLDIAQQRPYIAIGVLAGVAGVTASMFITNRWTSFPALQATVLVIGLLAAALILFYRWGDPARPQTWRKVVVYPLAALLGVELLAQGLALAGILPSLTQLTDSFASYGRIYQTAEGQRIGTANSDGWNYSEFMLYPDSRRILLFGDSFIQALQVTPEENLGVKLEQLIGANLAEGETVEVLALGYPDYGPGLYLNPPMFNFAIDAFAPDEVIAFFDLGSDFQIIDGFNPTQLYFVINEDGEVVLHPSNSNMLHTYQHEVLRGYEGVQPNRLLQSYLLTPQLIASLLDPPVASANNQITAPQNDIDLPNSFVFYPDSNAQAMSLATGHVAKAHTYLTELGIPFHLVTIPVFPDAFFEQSDWQTQFGQADLLLPEQELREFAAANDIPFLGLGAYMAAHNTRPDDVQDLYFNNGRGHFTSAGHEMAATAVYNCFFTQTTPADAGCDAR